MQYHIKIKVPVVGVEGEEVYEADSFSEAESIGYEIAYNHLAGYFEIWPETEEEPVGMGWGADFIYENEIDFYIEEISPLGENSFI